VEQIYTDGSTIAGDLQIGHKVQYKKILTKHDQAGLLFFTALIMATSVSLLWFLAQAAITIPLTGAVIAAIGLMIVVEILRVLQSITVLVFAWFAKDPVPLLPQRNLRIAVLTTIVPGKEPLELVAETLKKMKKIDPGVGNTLDVWLLDEGDDPEVRLACHAMDVKHFSRKGHPEWNTETGPFHAKTKHGNHNAWRAAHENEYDIVAQMDPDHVPRKNFLMRIIGYFQDPDVGFVVAPQVYGNMKDNWIAKASACQAFIFHGIIQRGGNGMGAPLLIGTNHAYRVKAWQEIGGYQDSIIEDHLTSMVMSGATNSRTGNKWKGVYTPDILAVGEGPSSFTDYFNQQKRWAYGICDIIGKHSFRGFKNLTKLQTLTFIMLQFFYPSLAIAWVLGALVTLLFGVTASQYEGLGSLFALLWTNSVIACLWLFFWLRRFNLVPFERKMLGLEGIVLTLMCLPYYFSAAWEAVTRKPLTFAVTAKGNLTSPDNLQTFRPHFNWLLATFASMAVITAVSNQAYNSSVLWSLIRVVVCTIPVAVYIGVRYRTHSITDDLKSFFDIRRSPLVQLATPAK
jgi:cellulose synthase (UDP-forming)